MKNKTPGLHSSIYGICNGLRAALSGACTVVEIYAAKNFPTDGGGFYFELV